MKGFDCILVSLFEEQCRKHTDTACSRTVNLSYLRILAYPQIRYAVLKDYDKNFHPGVAW